LVSTPKAHQVTAVGYPLQYVWVDAVQVYLGIFQLFLMWPNYEHAIDEYAPIRGFLTKHR
jgi:hypothetical protein